MASDKQPTNDYDFFLEEVAQRLFFMLESYNNCNSTRTTMTQEELKSKITNLMQLSVIGDRHLFFLKLLFDIIGEKDSEFYGRYGQMKYNEK